MKYKVIITDLAFARMLAQAQYIAVEGGSPQHAETWLERAIAAAESLETMPRRCPPCS